MRRRCSTAPSARGASNKRETKVPLDIGGLVPRRSQSSFSFSPCPRPKLAMHSCKAELGSCTKQKLTEHDMTKRSPTTKDIGLLYQLFTNGQLTLAPEFQRNSVWPSAAKAYLIDTILNDRPIPLLFIQRTTSAQKGLPAYAIIDGQQRLRAIFEYLDNRFRLTQSQKNSIFANKRFSELSQELQDRITNYDLVVEELSGYSEADIRDMFVRFNRFVVQL
jgi:hypothetical protein